MLETSDRPAFRLAESDVEHEPLIAIAAYFIRSDDGIDAAHFQSAAQPWYGVGGRRSKS